MSKPLLIETERLRLRDFANDDWSAVHRYATDPEVYRFQHWGPNTETDSRSFVELCIRQKQESPRRSFEFAIIENETDALIGAMGIRVKSVVNRDADIGYALRRESWGRGYATEATKAILDFGFQTLNLHRIWATAAPDNLASIRVLEKVGMQREGLLKDHVWVRGQWRDSVLLAMIGKSTT